jgi:hypothetical protein
MKKSVLRKFMNGIGDVCNLNAQKVQFEYTVTSCICKFKNVHNLTSNTVNDVRKAMSNYASTMLEGTYTFGVRNAPGLSIICTIDNIVVDEEVKAQQKNKLAELDLHESKGTIKPIEHSENEWLLN